MASKKGRVTGTGATYSFSTGALSFEPGSTIETLSERRFRVKVTCLAARALAHPANLTVG